MQPHQVMSHTHSPHPIVMSHGTGASSAVSSGSNAFVSPLTNSAALRDRTNPRRGRSKHPIGSKGATNFGRTRVITPQSFVAWTVNPTSDKANRLQGADDECFAPYESDESAYACLEGEIAWVRKQDANLFNSVNGLPITVMPGMHVFTNMAGLPLSELENIRPVGMMKNGGQEFGVGNGQRDDGAGVVIGQGLCTITNTGPMPIVAGQHVMAVPWVWMRQNHQDPTRMQQGLTTSFVTGKWYGSTYSVADHNTLGLVKGLHNLMNQLIGPGKTMIDTDNISVYSTETMKSRITSQLETEFALTDRSPMWNYGLLRAGLRMMDAIPEPAPGEPMVESVTRFIVDAYNRCLMQSNRTARLYDEAIGSKLSAERHVWKIEVLKNLTYTKFNRAARSLIEQMMANLQNKAEDYLRNNIIGVASTGAASGRTFEILLGYKC